MAAADVHGSTEVELVAVANGAQELVDADGLDQGRVLLAVGVHGRDGDVDFDVSVGLQERGFEAGDEVARTNDAHQGGVVAALLVGLMLLGDRLAGRLIRSPVTPS